MHDCLRVSPGAKREACPREGFWNDVTNKWTIQIMATLTEAGDRPVRFEEFRRRIDGVSAKVLAAALRRLERDGMVARREYPGYPSHVEYQLTRVGAGLLPALDVFMRWMTENWPEVHRARAAFDATGRNAD